MRNTTDHLHGPAPTSEQVDAAMDRARKLRSEAVHGYLAAARGGLGRAFRRLRPAVLFYPAAAIRGGVAPTQVARQPFWSMSPDSARWLHALRNRVL